jgi:hypothetical protein
MDNERAVEIQYTLSTIATELQTANRLKALELIQNNGNRLDRNNWDFIRATGVVSEYPDSPPINIRPEKS